MKRFLCLLLTLAILLPVFACAVPEAAAAGTYDPYAAITYAENHWNDGKGLCAEFVWNCVNAGGLHLSANGLHDSAYMTTGVAEACCNALGIPYTGVKDFPLVSITHVEGFDSGARQDDPLNAEIGIGDLIFSYCETCGKTSHVEICSGYQDGYLTVYSHNPALNGDFLSGGKATGEHAEHELSCRFLSLSDETGKDCACRDFFDVRPTEWYHSYVDEVNGYDLMNGVSDHFFDPEGSMTRAMLVTVLWRFSGSPTVGKIVFNDVKDDAWYAKAVGWAAANGVVNGVGDNLFAPDNKITREQMAAILFRFADLRKANTKKRAVLDTFPDSGSVSTYAVDAFQWCVAEGIIGGSDGKLLPQGNATRAQVGAILIRFIERFGCMADSGVLGENHTWKLTVDGTLTISGEGALPSNLSFDVAWSAQRSYIKKLVIDQGVTTCCGFAGYRSLQEVFLADSVTIIGDGAFKGCVNLTKIVLPNSISTIGNRAFCDCTSLSELKLPPAVTMLGIDAFENTSLQRIDVPASVETLLTKNLDIDALIPCPVYVDPANTVFSNDAQGVLMSKDKSVLISAHRQLSGMYTLPVETKTMMSYAFCGCDQLTSVVIPEGIEEIPEFAFYKCSALRSVSFPNTLKRINYQAFKNCVSLTEVTIPASVEEMGYLCFIFCNSMRAIYFLGDMPVFDGAFAPSHTTIYYIVEKEGWSSSLLTSRYDMKTWIP